MNGAGAQGAPTRPSIEMARSSVEIPQRESSLTAITVNHDAEPHVNGGDAARGKTGRMLDKLIAEKEALVRDFKFENGAKLLYYREWRDTVYVAASQREGG